MDNSLFFQNMKQILYIKMQKEMMKKIGSMVNNHPGNKYLQEAQEKGFNHYIETNEATVEKLVSEICNYEAARKDAMAIAINQLTKSEISSNYIPMFINKKHEKELTQALALTDIETLELMSSYMESLLQVFKDNESIINMTTELFNPSFLNCLQSLTDRVLTEKICEKRNLSYFQRSQNEKRSHISEHRKHYEKEPKWLIERLIPEKTLCVLSGKAECGKSYLTLNIILDFMTGSNNALNELEAQEGAVYYFSTDSEDAEPLLQRLNQLIDESTIDELPLYFQGKPFFKETGLDPISKIEKEIVRVNGERETPIRLLVIDSYFNLVPKNISTEQKTDLFKSIPQDLRSICKSLNLSVLLINHKKDGKEVGTESLLINSDEYYRLNRYKDEQSGKETLYINGGKRFKGYETLIFRIKNGIHFNYTGVNTPKKDNQQEDIDAINLSEAAQTAYNRLKGSKALLGTLKLIYNQFSDKKFTIKELVENSNQKETNLKKHCQRLDQNGLKPADKKSPIPIFNKPKDGVYQLNKTGLELAEYLVKKEN